MVIRLSMEWNNSYADFNNQHTNDLVTTLEKSVCVLALLCRYYNYIDILYESGSMSISPL